MHCNHSQAQCLSGIMQENLQQWEMGMVARGWHVKIGKSRVSDVRRMTQLHAQVDRQSTSPHTCFSSRGNRELAAAAELLGREARRLLHLLVAAGAPL